MVHRYQAYTRRPAPGPVRAMSRPAQPAQGGPPEAGGPFRNTENSMDKESTDIERYGKYDVPIEQLGFTAGELANRIVDTVETYITELVEKQTREGFRRELTRYLSTTLPGKQAFANPAEDKFINDQMYSAFWGPQTPVNAQKGWDSPDEWRVPPVPNIPDQADTTAGTAAGFTADTTDFDQTPPRH